MKAQLKHLAGLCRRLFDFLQFLGDIELIIRNLKIIEDMREVGVVKAARKQSFNIEIVRERLPVPVAVDAVAAEEILLVLLLRELAVRHAYRNPFALASEELQHHEALVTGDHLVVRVDHRQFDEVEFLERTLQILHLLWGHGAGIFYVGHEVADFFLDCAPC